MSRVAGRTNLPLYIAVGVIAALVVAAAIAVFARSAPEPLAPASPEGVVQQYAEAVIAGDTATARGLLVPRLADDCEQTEPDARGDTRVTLIRSNEQGARATVDVDIVTSDGGGLFGPSDYRQEGSFVLERTGDGWVVAEAPWMFTICWERY